LGIAALEIEKERSAEWARFLYGREQEVAVTLQETDAKLKDSRATVSQLEAHLESIEKELKSAQAALAEREDELRGTKADLQNSQANLSSTELALRAMEDKFSRQHEDIAGEVEEGRVKESQLRRELGLSTEENAVLERRLGDAMRKLEVR
jgi:peptidoglycan hydrolase CwlO-like protein